MAELHLYDVISRPVVTEKSNDMAESSTSTPSKLRRTANKIQITEAVEIIFDVDVSRKSKR